MSLVFSLFSCDKNPTVSTDTDTVTDIDGNVYNTVKIGNQWWMAENLRVTHYRNNDPIPQVIENTSWNNLNTGAFCIYGNDDSNVDIYGNLYNFYAVNDDRNIAPDGWHVAKAVDWNMLVTFLGGTDVAGGSIKEAGTTHWWSPNNGATNESGFTALPGGYRNAVGTYLALGVAGIWWTSTSFDIDNASTWHLDYMYFWILHTTTDKQEGISIRCVKD